MDAVEVATVVYLPREEVFEFLLDFPGYVQYSKYLEEVRAFGEGGPGTEYALRFSWWKIGYTARSRVTGIDRPERIDWELVKDVDASGHWRTETVSPPDGRDHATRVTFRAEFDADSADADAFGLPPLVPLDRVVEKARPTVEAEAERVVRRIVRDLEGESRDVDVEIRTTTSAR